MAPQETLILGPATGVFTDITGTYAIPPNATTIYFECVGGGGGGASGGLWNAALVVGAAGGGGGGRSFKWVGAAALRAQYPTGIPYTVGHGGQGAAANVTLQSDGTNGTAGGYTYVGDFVVATPGNLYAPAVGGHTSAQYISGGAAGLGDTPGAGGGCGGGLWQYYLNGNPTNDGTGGNGGYPSFYFGGIGSQNYYVANVQAAGGGGGGGGGGGVQSFTAFNGGNSGFAISTDPAPLTGVGGVVGGAQPTSAGHPAGVTVSTQGGGGGGAANVLGAGQTGASALMNSGSGGGGGGSSCTGSGGAGGNGGSGFLRIVAF
jgi:hypothetical protein